MFPVYPALHHLTSIRDTVSSVGIVKTDVHITASATVTNACHFRHALALDERRVKFMPEYFSEMNTHRHEIESRRFTGSDVKEVWFAGCHSDVYVILIHERHETDGSPAVGQTGNMIRTKSLTLSMLAMYHFYG